LKAKRWNKYNYRQIHRHSGRERQARAGAWRNPARRASQAPGGAEFPDCATPRP
jgi:hypothetical protein